jgi:multidrug resistance efflux pump
MSYAAEAEEDRHEATLAELDGERRAHSRTRAALKAAEAQAAHWKANHDAQVERARFLIERDDIPKERVRAWDAFDKFHSALQKACYAAGLHVGDDITRDLVPRIWLLRELLWNAEAYATRHDIRLPFHDVIKQHAGLSTDEQHGNV